MFHIEKGRELLVRLTDAQVNAMGELSYCDPDERLHADVWYNAESIGNGCMIVLLETKHGDKLYYTTIERSNWLAGTDWEVWCTTKNIPLN